MATRELVCDVISEILTPRRSELDTVPLTQATVTGRNQDESQKGHKCQRG